MTYGELPIGAVVCFGDAEVRSFFQPAVDSIMRWTKASDDGRAIRSDRHFSYMQTDAPRGGSGLTDSHRQCGFNFFPETHLFNYLNSADENWEDRADGDSRYSSLEIKGFLSRFTSSERNVLQQWTMSTFVPPPFREKYGKVDERLCYVGIPSIYEYMPEGTYQRSKIGEGTPLTITHYMGQPLLRSYMGQKSMSRCGQTGTVVAVSPTRDSQITPIISIKSDTKVIRRPQGEWYISIVDDEQQEFIRGLDKLISV